MTDIDITTFPEGATVKAYPRTNWPAVVLSPSGAPVGSESASAVVSGGVAAFTGLSAGEYFAYALVGSEHRYVRFEVGDFDDIPGPPLESPVSDALAAIEPGLWNIRGTGRPTGVNDIALIQQGILDAIAHDAAGLYLPSGSYGVPTPDLLSITRDGFKIRGDGPGSTILDASGVTAASGSLLSAAGSLGADIPLISNATTNTTTVVVANGSYAVGDRFKLSSTTVYGSTNQPEGEFVRVLSVAVDSPSPGQTTLTLYAPLHADYLTSASAKIKKATMIADVGVSDLSIIGPSDATRLIVGLKLDTVLDPVVQNLGVRRTHNAGIQALDVLSGRFSNLGFADIDGAGLAYGLTFGWACEDCNVHQVNGRRMRHVVTHGGGSSRPGIPRRVESVGIIGSEMKEAAMDCHPAGEDIHWLNCICDGSAQDGFVFQARSGSAKQMRARNCTRHGFLLQSQTVKALDYEVEIRARKCGSCGFAMSTTAAYSAIDHLHIDADTADTGSTGVLINDTQDITTTALSFGRVKVRRAGGQSLRIDKANGFTVGELDIGIGAALRGVQLNNCTDGILADGLIDNVEAVANGIAVDLHACDKITIGTVKGRSASKGILQSNDTTNTRVGGGSDFSLCTTPYTPGSGAGHQRGVLLKSDGTLVDPFATAVVIPPTLYSDAFAEERTSEVATLPYEITSVTGTLTSGIVYFVLAFCRTAGTYTKIRFTPGTLGTGMTDFRLGVWDLATAAYLAQTGDVHAALVASTEGVHDLGAGAILTEGQWVSLVLGGVWSGGTQQYKGNGPNSAQSARVNKSGYAKVKTASAYAGGTLPSIGSGSTGAIPLLELAP